MWKDNMRIWQKKIHLLHALKSCLSLDLYLEKCENSWYFLLYLGCSCIKYYPQDKNDHVVTASICQIQVNYIPNVSKLCHLCFKKIMSKSPFFVSLGHVKQRLTNLSILNFVPYYTFITLEADCFLATKMYI